MMPSAEDGSEAAVRNACHPAVILSGGAAMHQRSTPGPVRRPKDLSDGRTRLSDGAAATVVYPKASHPEGALT